MMRVMSKYDLPDAQREQSSVRLIQKYCEHDKVLGILKAVFCGFRNAHSDVILCFGQMDGHKIVIKTNDFLSRLT